MSDENLGEDLNLRLDFGKQAPELVFALDRGLDGTRVTLVEGTLDGLKHLDELIKDAIRQIEKVLPVEVFNNEVKQKITEQFRLGFYYLLQHP